MKKTTFIIIAVIVSILSIVMTIVIINNINEEDKVLLNVLNGNYSNIERNYTYSRTYILKDGTVIQGTCGSNTGILN